MIAFADSLTADLLVTLALETKDFNPGSKTVCSLTSNQRLITNNTNIHPKYHFSRSIKFESAELHHSVPSSGPFCAMRPSRAAPILGTRNSYVLPSNLTTIQLERKVQSLQP